jgi:hypothetical protein
MDDRASTSTTAAGAGARKSPSSFGPVRSNTPPYAAPRPTLIGGRIATLRAFADDAVYRPGAGSPLAGYTPWVVDREKELPPPPPPARLSEEDEDEAAAADGSELLVVRRVPSEGEDASPGVGFWRGSFV